MQIKAVKKSLRLTVDTCKTLLAIKVNSDAGETNWSGSVNALANQFNTLIDLCLPELSENERLAFAMAYNGRVQHQDIEQEAKMLHFNISEGWQYNEQIQTLFTQEQALEFIDRVRNWSLSEKISVIHKSKEYWATRPIVDDETGANMNPEIKQNYQEKLRLVVVDSINDLSNEIEAMLRKQSAKGKIRSGNTINLAMDLISKSNAEIFEKTINHLNFLDITYYPAIESDIQSLVKSAQELFKTDALIRFQAIIETTGFSKKIETMLPTLESKMASDLAKFQNNLNAACIKLKLNNI